MSQETTVEAAPHTVADAFLEALAEVNCLQLSHIPHLTLIGWHRLPFHRPWLRSS